MDAAPLASCSLGLVGTSACCSRLCQKTGEGDAPPPLSGSASPPASSKPGRPRTVCPAGSHGPTSPALGIKRTPCLIKGGGKAKETRQMV